MSRGTEILIVLLLILGLSVGMFYGGYSVRGKFDVAKQAVAAAAAREQERQAQEKVNHALTDQYTAVAGINARLRAELERLRVRKARPVTMSKAARAACEGADGPELARKYAGFLARYAAIAAKQQESLKTCYAAVDAAQGK